MRARRLNYYFWAEFSQFLDSTVVCKYVAPDQTRVVRGEFNYLYILLILPVEGHPPERRTTTFRAAAA